MKIRILAAAALVLAGCSESKDTTDNRTAETALEGAESVSQQPIEIAPAGGGGMTGIDAATGSAAAMPADTGPIAIPAVAGRSAGPGTRAPGPASARGERAVPPNPPSPPIVGNQIGNTPQN